MLFGTVSCDVNFSCRMKEEHVTKEHCGRSGIMGYVTFHHKTRRGPPAVTWETASVVFLTTTMRHIAHHKHTNVCVCVSSTYLVPEKAELMMWWHLNLLNCTQRCWYGFQYWHSTYHRYSPVIPLQFLFPPLLKPIWVQGGGLVL